jgi:hypothetical protein
MKWMKILVKALDAALMVASAPLHVVSPGRGLTRPHYTLNVIGIPRQHRTTVKGWFDPDRRTIFVPIDGKVLIAIQRGDDFAVIDADGIGGIARFRVGPGNYEVYAAALGRPHGYVTISPHATVTTTTAMTDFSVSSVLLRYARRPAWKRLTGLFMADVALDCRSTTSGNDGEATWIFSVPDLRSSFWHYDSHGCSHLQVHFYPSPERRAVPTYYAPRLSNL